MFGEIARFFFEGGLFMYPILLIGVAAIALISERYYVLNHRFSINDRAFVDKVLELVKKGDVAGARKMCDDTPVPAIVHAALSQANQPTRDIQNAVDERAMDVLPQVEKRLPYLAMAANLSTLLGLLGTIQGLIQSFAAVSAAEASQKGALLAKGIAVAMNTTAFGLIVAIPCLAAFTFLQSKSQRIIEQIDRASVRMVNFLGKEKG